MSFGAVANVGNFELQGFPWPSAPVVERSNFPKLVVRNETNTNSTDYPTINMFVDGLDENMGYEASIVEACSQHTVFELRCTKGPSYLGAIGTAACGPNAPAMTVTGGPSTYALSTSTATRTLGVDVSVSLAESCKLQGTTAAVCTATVGGVADGTSTGTSSTMTLSGTDYHRYDVAITGGAEKTANPTACAANNGGANQGGNGDSAAANLNTKAVALWGLIGAASVVAFLGC